jgi:hypothetical protein
VFVSRRYRGPSDVVMTAMMDWAHAVSHNQLPYGAGFTQQSESCLGDQQSSEWRPPSDRRRQGFPQNVLWSNDLPIWHSVSYCEMNIFSPSSMPFGYSITIDFNFPVLIIQLEITCSELNASVLFPVEILVHPSYGQPDQLNHL